MPLRQAMSSAVARRVPATAWPTRGHEVAVPGSAGVRYVLAGRVDEVGPGLGAADLNRAPAELGVKAPGLRDGPGCPLMAPDHSMLLSRMPRLTGRILGREWPVTRLS